MNQRLESYYQTGAFVRYLQSNLWKVCWRWAALCTSFSDDYGVIVVYLCIKRSLETPLHRIGLPQCSSLTTIRNSPVCTSAYYFQGFIHSCVQYPVSQVHICQWITTLQHLKSVWYLSAPELFCITKIRVRTHWTQLSVLYPAPTLDPDVMDMLHSFPGCYPAFRFANWRMSRCTRNVFPSSFHSETQSAHLSKWAVIRSCWIDPTLLGSLKHSQWQLTVYRPQESTG